jgi:hypothetical protein
VVCIEFVEVNPLLDTKGNKMAETAFEVLEAITSTLLLPMNNNISIKRKSRNQNVDFGFFKIILT